MARRIPHPESQVEVRRAFQQLDNDVATLESQDHGDLGGLEDDDHTQYLLADGTRTLTDDLAVTALKTIDGRDLSVDGAKLDLIEAEADVTDAANVEAAGAAMAGGAFHDGFSDFVAAEHISLPNTIATVLSDHDLAAHTVLGLFDQHTDVDHDQTTNTHNLTTDIDHNTITNAHDLTTNIDHDTITNTHNLTTDIDHDTITNTHNLTTDIDHDQTTNYDANKHVDHTGVEIATAATSGISGGGTIASTRNLALNIDGLTGESAIAAADTLAFHDDTAGASRKITLTELSTALGAADEKVKVDAAATAGYLGVAAGDGVLRTNAAITWADGGDFVTLSCNPGYVGCGDPAAFDFEGIDPAGDFVCDNTYRDLDLSGLISAGAYAVVIKIGFRATIAGEYMRFKKKGNSNNPSCFRPTITSANTYVNYEGTVEVDSNRKLEYSGTSNLDLIYVLIKGWYV